MSRQPWTEVELALLRDVSLSLKEVAERTGRPIKGCYNQASRLGIRRYREEWVPPPRLTDRRQWSARELGVLAEPGLPYQDVAVRTGRSYDSVKVQARRRGLHRRIYWAQEDYQPGANDYRGRGWKKLRVEILERDGFTCQDGGEYIPSGQGLVVHHEIPWRLLPANDSRFLVTLCRRHHMRRPEHRWLEVPEDMLLLLKEGR
jgi:5-methylcytosine-specific restriction endonuclease McrA